LSRRIPTPSPPSGIEGIGSDDRGLVAATARGSFRGIGPLAIGGLKYKTQLALFETIWQSAKPASLDFPDACAKALEIQRAEPTREAA
jgi:methylene-tetrahydromethanopterin dehydrogenase